MKAGRLVSCYIVWLPLGVAVLVDKGQNTKRREERTGEADIALKSGCNSAAGNCSSRP